GNINHLQGRDVKKEKIKRKNGRVQLYLFLHLHLTGSCEASSARCSSSTLPNCSLNTHLRPKHDPKHCSGPDFCTELSTCFQTSSPLNTNIWLPENLLWETDRLTCHASLRTQKQQQQQQKLNSLAKQTLTAHSVPRNCAALGSQKWKVSEEEV
ncbi:hypothetical protein CIB84_004034, partial [Bambusicola thoracicus]